tara:strand:+ start:107 stop:439 length:333 start_codon:yes stop_codon:yes gene_type:complete
MTKSTNPINKDTIKLCSKSLQDLEIIVCYEERPVLTMIVLCIYKPDIAFIMMVYFMAYLFLFYICVVKVILICNEGYLYTLSKLSPETIELLHFFYSGPTNILNSIKSWF